jgi:hypothetical protein
MLTLTLTITNRYLRVTAFTLRLYAFTKCGVRLTEFNFAAVCVFVNSKPPNCRKIEFCKPDPTLGESVKSQGERRNP